MYVKKEVKRRIIKYKFSNLYSNKSMTIQKDYMPVRVPVIRYENNIASV